MIWVVRSLLSTFLLKCYLIAALFAQSFVFVSWGSVFLNAPKRFDIGAQYAFFSSAFSHTEAATVLLFAIAGIILVFLARDMMSNMQNIRKVVA